MKHVVFSTVLLIATVTMAQGSRDAFSDNQANPQTMIGATWESQYIWRGFDVYGGDSTAHILADMGLFHTGFGVSAVGHQDLSDPFGNGQRWDGTFYYQGGLFSGGPLAMNYRLGYVYYYYVKPNRGRTEDLMEGQLILSWPNLLPIDGLQPSYAFAYMWPGRKNRWAQIENPNFDDNATGMFHIFMLDYAFTVPALIPALGDQVVKLHSELVYNGGVSPFGTKVNSGFSDAVLGASTDFAFGAGRNIVLTPAVYYQFTLEDTVNPDDEFWASISLKWAF